MVLARLQAFLAARSLFRPLADPALTGDPQPTIEGCLPRILKTSMDEHGLFLLEIPRKP